MWRSASDAPDLNKTFSSARPASPSPASSTGDTKSSLLERQMGRSLADDVQRLQIVDPLSLVADPGIRWRGVSKTPLQPGGLEPRVLRSYVISHAYGMRAGERVQMRKNVPTTRSI